jgi:hypothetical protein
MMVCYGIYIVYMYELLLLYVIIIPLNYVHMQNISIYLMVSEWQKREFCVTWPSLGVGYVTKWYQSPVFNTDHGWTT